MSLMATYSFFGLPSPKKNKKTFLFSSINLDIIYMHMHMYSFLEAFRKAKRGGSLFLV